MDQLHEAMRDHDRHIAEHGQLLQQISNDVGRTTSYLDRLGIRMRDEERTMQETRQNASFQNGRLIGVGLVALMIVQFLGAAMVVWLEKVMMQ